MLKAKCIEKIRDKNNHIIGYKIVGNDKKPIPVKSESLKKAIRSGQIEITNLTLTSDNRLIDKKPDTPSKTTSSSKQNINIESLINRVKALGYTLNTFDTDCGHKCYIASLPDNAKHVFIIPDNVKYVYKTSYVSEKELYSYMSNIKGTLKVVGGKNLISAHAMFIGCKVQHLDLRSFDTSNVTDMQSMFESCKAQSLDLSSFNTSNVTDMQSMFHGCEAHSLDLSSFDTRNVIDMREMFWNCNAQSINLSSFNTSNVTDMHFMFGYCAAQSIDLSSFDTSSVTDMSGMFGFCKVHTLDLSSFNTSNVKNMSNMFAFCEAQSIDLRSFDTSNVEDMSYMFSNCKAQIKINDPNLKAQLQKDRR